MANTKHPNPYADYINLALNADLKRALGKLSSLRLCRSKKHRRLRSIILARFVDQTEKPRVKTRDDLIRSLVLAYRGYYRDCMLMPRLAKKFDEDLLSQLNQLCQTVGATTRFKKFPDAENFLAKECSKRGFHTLWGEIAPYRSLLVWQQIHTKKFNVKLVSGRQPVTVHFLKGFIELGWAHFATVGQRFVGGWANQEALFCVEQAYKLDTRRFMVSFLHHEAQHFYDYTAHKRPLTNFELECRAKLAEMAASARPRLLLTKFQSEAKNDPKVPHAKGAYLLVTQLEALIKPKKLIDASPNDLRSAVEKILSMRY